MAVKPKQQPNTRMCNGSKLKEEQHMIINHNLSAMNAHRQLGANQANGAKAQEKLSSGLRINRAGDDAAGLAISEKMRAQVRGLDQASRNGQDGISMIQTAEGALGETHSILQRMRELATQAANDTNVEVDREEIQKEINALTSEINRIGNTTEFNKQKVLDGAQKIGNVKTVEGSEAVEAEGDNPAIDAVIGSVSFDITKAFEVGDTITVGGKTITFVEGDITEDADEVSLSSAKTTEEQASAIAALINGVEDSEITASTTGKTVSIVQNEAGTGTVSSPVITNSKGDGFSATFQIGANKGQSMTINFLDMRSEALGIAGKNTGTHTAGTNDKAVAVAGAKFAVGNDVTNGTTNDGEAHALDVSSHESATAAVEVINNAIEAVSAERSKMGSYQNRLEHTISNLNNSSENLQAAESRVRDVDMAKEIMEFTKNNILSQASQSMLAQANQAPQQVLQLLG